MSALSPRMYGRGHVSRRMLTKVHPRSGIHSVVERGALLMSPPG